VERRDVLHKIQRFEDDMRGTVAAGHFELMSDIAEGVSDSRFSELMIVAGLSVVHADYY
jgi:hypothetical protein